MLGFLPPALCPLHCMQLLFSVIYIARANCSLLKIQGHVKYQRYLMKRTGRRVPE